MMKKRRRSDEAVARHRQRYNKTTRRRIINDWEIPENKDLNCPSRTVSDTPITDHRPLCKYYYRTGSCLHGSDCRFSHNCLPLTSKELKLCRYFLMGPTNCKYTAAECKYSHEPGLFLCRNNIVNGECNNLLRCKFKHIDSASITSLDDAERLQFCYNNKRFLTEMLFNRSTETYKTASDVDSATPEITDEVVSHILALKDSFLSKQPWYLQYTHLLLARDYAEDKNG
ncbi:Zinc finger C-x8-C-x5-C-x3-H type (and similar) family protein [Babesia bovis T2Bo]|uniref:C3H1-type domain-containing protein n=1 Tax=Babesia bovis TaxID=5865 RepID=A7AT40_BABBO|nr:Zinc finger C-x8-C-x5-C-x3-H type (and similar) family protein [Babesia bovis T2Bo]EDO06101.1 Zinc finger C-x8-C-x5-C-x3-H type (and similar) family protein [Babesia bovis T2Bo]|eukprot:XP_001609669.1 hypothetical protein [Babesia bovis T2Bo]